MYLVKGLISIAKCGECGDMFDIKDPAEFKKYNFHDCEGE